VGTGRPATLTLLRPTRRALVALYGPGGYEGEGWLVGLTAGEESVVFGCSITVNQVSASCLCLCLCQCLCLCLYMCLSVLPAL